MNLRKIVLTFITVLVLAAQSTALAAPNWDKVVTRIEQTMNQALDMYKNGDVAGAKKMVNEAYYGMYEKEGLETAIRSTISSKRAALSEYKFSTVKKLMTKQAPEKQIKEEIDEMVDMMREDVQQMSGGKGHSAWGNFWPAFMIMIREGVEAILVLGAIIAYLIKSGNEQKLQTVYYYSAAAIMASFLTAIIFQSIVGASGANQEIMEGATMLVAVVVLLSVSHWMGSKSDSKAWSSYIQGKVQHSLTSRNTFALGMAAFLSVYREGAEVVLFYQVLFNGAGDDVSMIWAGFGLGCLALVAIFALVRYGTVRIPLKPFFRGTSIFMSLMAFSFTGSGMKELQEGGVVGVTQIEGMPMIDLLGIYPTWETLLPQIVLVIIVIAGFFYQKRKNLKEEVSA